MLCIHEENDIVLVKGKGEKLNGLINSRSPGTLNLQNKNHGFDSDIDLVTQNIKNTFACYILRLKVMYII